MASRPHPAPVYGIDIVRFLAATTGVFYHFSAKPFLTPHKSSVAGMLGQNLESGLPPGAVWWGWVGVQVFFVVSGAVIGFSVADADWRKFLISRVSRLWPMLLLVTPFIAFFNIVALHQSPAAVGGKILLTLVLWPPGPWISGQFWTLPIEISFYTLVGLVLALKRRELFEPMAWAIGLASFAYWIARSVGLIGQGPVDLWLLLWHGVYLALGMMLVISAVAGLTGRRLALILICLAGSWLEVGGALNKELGGLGYDRTVPFLAFFAMTGFIWWSLAHRERFAEVLQAIPGAPRVVRTLGLLTYPLYIVHVQPGGLVESALMSAGVPAWGAILSGYAVAILISLVLVLWIEPPAQRGLRQMLERVVPGGRVPATARRKPA